MIFNKISSRLHSKDRKPRLKDLAKAVLELNDKMKDLERRIDEIES